MSRLRLRLWIRFAEIVTWIDNTILRHHWFWTCRLAEKAYTAAQSRWDRAAREQETE